MTAEELEAMRDSNLTGCPELVPDDAGTLTCCKGDLEELKWAWRDRETLIAFIDSLPRTADGVPLRLGITVWISGEEAIVKAVMQEDSDDPIEVGISFVGPTVPSRFYFPNTVVFANLPAEDA